MISATGEDQFGISFKKLAKGVGKGIAKGAKGVGKGAVAAGKVAAQAYLLPFKLALKAVIKLVIPMGRALCAVPTPILSVGATAAGVSMNVVPMFCTALNLRNMAEVRRLLPPVLKIAVKVAATGAAPGLSQAINMIRIVPGLKLIPGLSFLAGPDEFGAEPSTLELLDAIPMYVLESAVDEMSDAELEGAIDAPKYGVGLALGLSGAALATGLYFAFRR